MFNSSILNFLKDLFAFCEEFSGKQPKNLTAVFQGVMGAKIVATSIVDLVGDR